MKKNRISKMSLNRETLHRLGDLSSEALRVAGGTTENTLFPNLLLPQRLHLLLVGVRLPYGLVLKEQVPHLRGVADVSATETPRRSFTERASRPIVLGKHNL